MGKYAHDDVMDGALDVIATGDRIDVLSDSSTPTDLSNTLANGSLTPGDGNGDFTISNGDVSGRKLTIAQQADLLITSSGTARHVAVSLSGALLMVTTCTEQALVANGSNTCTVPAFDYEITDPS